MCTAITLSARTDEQFLGRTMDFSYDIIPRFFTTPTGYTWTNSLTGENITDHFRIIGIGQQADGLSAFFDGVNENGFAAAALYFAGYSKYEHTADHSLKTAIASIDFLHYLLGQCGSVADLPKLLQHTTIVGMQDPITKTIAPLHWIAADRTGACVVIEPTAAGITMEQNTIGVFANSPEFSWHMTNLRNFTQNDPIQVEQNNWGTVTLTPFGQANGTSSLPGGFTSPERFVRCAYLKTHIPVPVDQTEAINSCFHIMESVSIPKGAVITKHGTYDYTKYTAFMNLNTCEYFYRTYDDLQIRNIGLWQT